MRNDAFSNFLNSLSLAGHFVIPEVMIVIGTYGLRANRCRQIECDGFADIESPNFPYLVHFGINIEVNWQLVLRRENIEEEDNDKIQLNVINF